LVNLFELYGDDDDDDPETFKRQINNGLYVKCFFCGCPISTKFGRCGYILVNVANMEFLEKPTLGSARLLADSGMDGQTDVMRLLELVEEGSWRGGT
jgi:hypothetical protein